MNKKIALGTWSWGSGMAGGVSVSQIGVAYAINKGTTPIIGVTKPRHVIEAAQATIVRLTEEEIKELELLAKATGVDTKGSWENPMV